MGCFSSKKTHPAAVHLPPLTVFPIGHYPRKTVLNIWSNGKADTLYLTLPEPESCHSKAVSVAATEMKVSCNDHTGCVLPGLDPMGEDKLCQDIAFYEIRNDAVLLGVFDGHGQWGHRVVRFCRRLCATYLELHTTEAHSAPNAFLQSLCTACHTEVAGEGSGVNCNLSGSTAVLGLLTGGVLYVASIGDSRTVLASTKAPETLYVQQSGRDEDKPLLEQISALRGASCPETDMQAAQLTRDQKPDDPEEAQRIIAKGGEIRRSTDDQGKEAGPFRVWMPEHGYPGIAMSRSIGDCIAHRVGLTAEPELMKHRLRPDDKFVVLASDGLWDVMDNQEVCDFIEAHRVGALCGMDEPLPQEDVSLQTATIAQLLCEEARTRWLSVAEAEDVVIDDISCVVLEFDASSGSSSARRPQRLALRQSRRRSSGGKTPDSPPTPDTTMFLRRDERRASILGHFLQ